MSRWVLLGSGIGTALLGLFVLIRPELGTTVFYTILGAILVVIGAANVWEGLRRPDHRTRQLVGGGLSLLAGVAAIADPMLALGFFPGLPLMAAGVLAILFGLLNMSQFLARGQDGHRQTHWSRLGVGALALVLGVLVITNPMNSSLIAVSMAGLVLMVFGALLILLFALLQRNQATQA